MQEKLQEEVERFIRFGGVLDATGRRYLAAFVLKNLQLPYDELKEKLKPDYLAQFEFALRDVFSDATLQQLVGKNGTLAAQIAIDSLNWFRRTVGQLAKKHPYEDEQRELESWGVRHMRQFSKSYGFLIQKVGSFYPEEEIDASFHRDQFKQIFKDKEYEALNAEELEAAERILKDLLGQWDAKLQAKILRYQLSQLEGEVEQYQSALSAKAKEFGKLQNLVSPFTDYLGRYWDMSRSLWQDATFDILDQYADLLQDEKELQRLAELLGRLRKAELETEEATLEKIIERKEWVVDPNLKSEIVGIQQGADFNNLLPSEVALFGDATEWQFLKRFAEQQLLVNQYNDSQLINSNKVYSERYQRVKKKKKGPFIVCVDTSGSMEGEPERIAKILCFGILKMASATDRPAFLINFSTGIKTMDLYNLVDSIEEVTQFLQSSFRGGTDISLALNEALSQLETHKYRDADVLVISDFIMYKISPDLTQRMKKQQLNHGTQFHSLIITDQANEEVIDQFDNVWAYDPDEKRLMQMLLSETARVLERSI